jgi:putative ABC transport system permease protein
MKPEAGAGTARLERFQFVRRYASDFALAAANLLSQKTRTLLTALGIIFGVGAVIGMLAIGAGARDESLRFIEQLGVRNLLVESIPSTSDAELQQRRRTSQGLNYRDVRIIEANLDSMNLLSPRRILHPSRLLPKPVGQGPWLYGVRPAYAQIHGWNFAEGASFSEADLQSSAAVCVLGETAKTGLLGYEGAIGRYIKVEDTWLRVVGVLRGQTASGSQNLAASGSDVNNRIYIPLTTFQYRFWDLTGYLRDPLDGVDVQLKLGADSVQAAKVVMAILNSTHRGAQDFSVTIPAELLAEQQRAQVIFTYVMVAIAAISLLVGGIGIMNIVLATVLERTREIGIRRATGARRSDIVRQFLLESVLISIGGGALGIAFGYFLSWFIARAAEWKTIVTSSSILIAFGVSLGVGVVFGIYPALKAARIDPIEALRYE